MYQYYIQHYHMDLDDDPIPANSVGDAIDALYVTWLSHKGFADTPTNKMYFLGEMYILVSEVPAKPEVTDRTHTHSDH